MKTAEEKVDELLSNCITDVQTIAELKDRMIRLLKEQDRDTRHSCAEAVLICHRYDEDFISLDEAHAACMSAKAV